MFTGILEEESSLYNENEITDTTEKKPKSSNKNFTKFVKKNISDIPYLPIAFFIDSSYPNEIKEEIYSMIDKLLAKQYTIRINGDDKEFIDRLSQLNSDRIEVYIPWKNFNNIDSKFYFSHEALKSIARSNFLGWDKIPDTVKGILTRNVRMLLGTSNNSVCMCVVLYTTDGAVKKSQVTKETGKLSFVITTADKFRIPIINLKNKAYVEAFVKNFEI